MDANGAYRMYGWTQKKYYETQYAIALVPCFRVFFIFFRFVVFSSKFSVFEGNMKITHFLFVQKYSCSTEIEKTSVEH